MDVQRSAIYEDFIEIGLDSYNPLEAKSGLDVVELRRKYGHRMGFCGNIDALAWANDPLPDLESQVLRKMNAAKRRRVYRAKRSLGSFECFGRTV